MTASDPRLAPVYDLLQQKELDGIAFVPGANFQRLFATDFHLNERPLMVIVPVSGDPAAVVPNLEMRAFEALDFPGPVFGWRDEDGYRGAFEKAAQALPQLKEAHAFGLEAQRMRAFEHLALADVFPGATFIDAHQVLSAIRLCKTDGELTKLRRAVAISEQALSELVPQIELGMTETEIRARLLGALFSNGAEGLSFDLIVAAAGNSANPHARARSNYRIQPGDALLIDFGATCQGYCADMTRTFFVGHVSDEDRAFYETVQAANEKGRAVSRAGLTASEVDDAVQNVLEGSAFSEFMLHKTGHGLGIDVHEAPQIMRGNNETLRPGMVFTVEPGLYKAGCLGVRIEDDVVVTEEGVDCLTGFTRDVTIVG